MLCIMVYQVDTLWQRPGGPPEGMGKLHGWNDRGGSNDPPHRSHIRGLHRYILDGEISAHLRQLPDQGVYQYRFCGSRQDQVIS
jgi:hypothetical protein